MILDYKIKSNINLYNILETFLKSYKNELVEGLWFCRISTTEDLRFDQDYFLSWYPPEKLSDIIKTDMHYEVEGKFNNGYTNIYSRQLHLSPLETEGLNLIEYCLTRQEREEFLSKTVVIASGFYPKICKCKTLEEYHQRRTEHRGENTCQIKFKEKQTIKQTYEDNYFCYSDNLGDILITNLQKKACFI
uniref:Uncharacterized protein n=1 Tax=Rhodomela confervoides TaxID=35163 RepID=A0A1Z1M9A4_RHOCN|nr:hypothetical protein [Rhodomela confervoides]ARW62688.1 hypothetical protein [Rhodomela confervoides]